MLSIGLLSLVRMPVLEDVRGLLIRHNHWKALQMRSNIQGRQ